MSRYLAQRCLPSGLVARVVATDIRDGDLTPGEESAILRTRRASVAPLPWTWLRQAHGSDVVEVGCPGGRSGEIGDGAVTNRVGCTLSVVMADCVPIAILADGGGIGVVHAGWRGILSGVIQATVGLLSEVADGPFHAVFGPSIKTCCYEFGPDDLGLVVDELGDGVRGETDTGCSALDLVAAASAALRKVGVVELALDGTCTSCADDHWSFRASGTGKRHAMAAWLEAE